MNRLELISAMAEKTGLTKKDAEKALGAFMESVKEAVVSGDSVQLVGFGTFGITERAARTGKNPKTGEAISIPACKAPKFKAGKAFKDALK